VFFTIAGVTLALFAACEGGGMSGENAFVGTQDTAERGVSCYQCIEDIVPDPVDCQAAEKDIEFLPVTIFDFEGGVAGNLYAYYDASNAELSNGTTFDDAGNEETEDGGWQPATSEAIRCISHAEAVEADPAAVPNRALHFKGGPFTNWGGGLGRHFKCLNNGDSSDNTRGTGTVKAWEDRAAYQMPRACDATDPVRACATIAVNPDDEPQDPESVLARSACPERDEAFLRSGEDTSSLEDPDEEYLLGMTLDLREWDGISFWGRRSNDSDAGVRLALGDKYTSDDISFLQYHINPESTRHCERNVECGCGGNGVCTYRTAEEGGDNSYRCYDSPPIWIAQGEQARAQARFDAQGGADPDSDLVPLLFPAESYDMCGPSICGFGEDGTWSGEQYAAFGQDDYQIVNTACHVRTMRGGFEDKYCFDPEGDHLPVENLGKCGDHWVRSIHLSNQWQFYKIPFTSLLQEGWAKESFKLDLTSLAVLRFTFGTGYSDIWIDDVRVYRDLKNSTDD